MTEEGRTETLKWKVNRRIVKQEATVKNRLVTVTLMATKTTYFLTVIVGNHQA